MPPVGRRSARPSRRSLFPFVYHCRIIGLVARSRPLTGCRRGGPGSWQCLYGTNTHVYIRWRWQGRQCQCFVCNKSSEPVHPLCIVRTPTISCSSIFFTVGENMVFSSPAWVPPIPGKIPDSVPLSTFSLSGSDDVVGQDASRPLLADGLSGKTFSRGVLRQRVESLARALAQRLGWSPNEGSPWDKVVAIHSLNSVGAAVI